MNTSLQRHTARAALLCGVLLASAGCTTMGSGVGQTSPGGGGPVAFQWTNNGGNAGTMSATLADGDAYSGRYYQITSEARTQSLDAFRPLWLGWRRGWNDWGYGYGGFGPDTQFTTVYSGKVVANLEDSANHYMRCRFTLVQPSSGMNGGGQGECQIANGGATIAANFPPG